MLNLAELIILGAASYRGVQLLVHDTLTDPIRAAVEVRHVTKPRNRVWWFLHAVLGCPYCCGMYVAGTALLVYLIVSGQWGAAPWIVHGVEWFAVAGVAALANRWDDTRDAS